ncbi:uncharacterized protein LOC128283727 [Gossypium arboreum]|uniref:Uncharacterized protein n=1 Tax=Gossypium arboreum TaxID=29729 RepID=A0ABR0N0Q8_GOSAR|nr:uncharacterized protein LOC128283727 [Gossypium arboreum]KAK5784126.1 hypothetical protein PVK06_038645 [Gossypium arboreum]
MDSEGKRGHDESFASLRPVSVQELKDSTILPTSGNYNSELGIEALTRVVREVLEKVFEARTEERLQARCVDCGKKRDCNPPRLEPRSVNHVRTQLSGNSSFTVGAGSCASAPFCEHCKKCHPSN